MTLNKETLLEKVHSARAGGREIDRRFGEVIVTYLGDKVLVQFASAAPPGSQESIDYFLAEAMGITFPGTTFVLRRFEFKDEIVLDVYNVDRSRAVQYPSIVAVGDSEQIPIPAGV
ncbi:MAG: hypothetical protein AAB602_03175 [Patescibacteria group bacterium]